MYHLAVVRHPFQPDEATAHVVRRRPNGGDRRPKFVRDGSDELTFTFSHDSEFVILDDRLSEGKAEADEKKDAEEPIEGEAAFHGTDHRIGGDEDPGHSHGYRGAWIRPFAPLQGTVGTFAARTGRPAVEPAQAPHEKGVHRGGHDYREGSARVGSATQERAKGIECPSGRCAPRPPGVSVAIPDGLDPFDSGIRKDGRDCGLGVGLEESIRVQFDHRNVARSRGHQDELPILAGAFHPAADHQTAVPKLPFRHLWHG